MPSDRLQAFRYEYINYCKHFYSGALFSADPGTGGGYREADNKAPKPYRTTACTGISFYPG